MDFSPDTGKNRRNTGGILRIFACVRRKIGDSYGGHELISVSLGKKRRDTAASRRRVSSQAGSIARILAEVRRKIGGSYGGHELISVSLKRSCAKKQNE
jgi:hypothetical protein